MKKTLLMVVLGLSLLGNIVFAGTNYIDVRGYYSNVTLDGKAITEDSNGKIQPLNINSSVYLPIRAVAEQLGLDISWDNVTKTVIMKSNIPEPPTDTGNVVLYDKNNVKVSYIGLSLNEYQETEIDLLVENNSNQKIFVFVESIAINGYMGNGSLATQVTSGNNAKDSIYLYNFESTPENINKLEIQLYVTDENFNMIETGDIVEINR